LTLQRRRFLAAGAATVAAKGRPLVAGFSDGVVTTPVGGYGLALMKAR
jgi:hypothetical protein